jgi:hypothetical protein
MATNPTGVSFSVHAKAKHKMLTNAQQAIEEVKVNAPENHADEHDFPEKAELHHHQHKKDAALELLGSERVQMTDEQVSPCMCTRCRGLRLILIRVCWWRERSTSTLCPLWPGSSRLNHMWRLTLVLTSL